AKLEIELAKLEEQSAELTARWKAEKDQLHGAQKLKEQIEQARVDLEKAQRGGDFTRAGELTYGIIPDLERKLQAAQNLKDNAMLDEVVKESDIASVVSRWTGIPIDKMMQ